MFADDDLRGIENATKLGNIQALLIGLTLAHEKQEKRLFGTPEQLDGGMIGDLNKRVHRIERFFIAGAAGVVVFQFFLGNGPVSLAGLLHSVLNQAPGK